MLPLPAATRHCGSSIPAWLKLVHALRAQASGFTALPRVTDGVARPTCGVRTAADHACWAQYDQVLVPA